jgi:hypothetical protein
MQAKHAPSGEGHGDLIVTTKIKWLKTLTRFIWNPEIFGRSNMSSDFSRAVLPPCPPEVAEILQARIEEVRNGRHLSITEHRERLNALREENPDLFPQFPKAPIRP